MADQSTYYNAQAASLAAQVANQAAQLEFQRMRFQQLELPQFQEMTALQKEQLAFQKATEVWNEAFRDASLTGTYQGKTTTEWLATQAQLTGQFNGQQTLPALQQQAALTGTYQQPTILTPLEQERKQQLLDAIQRGTNTPEEAAEYQTLQLKEVSNTPTPTLANLAQQAQYLGTYNGQQTQQAQQQQFEQAMTLAGLTGMIPGTGAGGGVGGVGGVGGTGTVGGAGGAAGTPTMAYQQMLAQLTGQFNGAPTQAALEAAQQFGLSQAAITGLYNGNPTQAAQEFAANLAFQREQLAQSAAQFEQTFGLSQGELTGTYQGQNTLGRDTMENQQANQLLQLAASLRGPRDAFQFAKVIGGTPGGLSDILSSVAGRYNLPSYQGGGAAPQAVSLQNFVGDVQAQAAGQPGGYNPQVGQWGATAPSYQVSPPGAQAPTNAYNYQPTGDGSQMVYPPGISAPQQAGQISSTTPLSSTNLSQIGAQAMATQPYALPAPSQWNAENFNNLGDYRQQLMLGGYENAGYDPDAALAQFKQSLPTSGGPTTGKIAGIV